MSKHNYFVIFLRKINLLINSLLKKYLNKLNFNNLSKIVLSNKVLLTFVGLVIVCLSYLLIPHIYQKVEIRQELENQLLDKFDLNFNLSKNLNYNFFPRPHFVIDSAFILENQLEISNIKKLHIFVSLNNLFSLKNISIKGVILENSNFYFNKNNSDFFIKLLDKNFIKNSFVIENSNVFFKNNEKEVLFINKIIKMEYYHDLKELKNIISSENEIFNIPYSLELYKNAEKKIFSKINLNFLKLQIENEIDYYNNDKKGLLDIIYNKYKSKATYELNKNIFSFNYFDKSKNPDFIYDGKVNFNPFFSNLKGKVNNLDLSTLFNSDLFFVKIFKTEVLNNKNLNINLSIGANQIKQYQNFINIFFNFKILEGLIDIDETKFSWNDYVNFEIIDSLLYVNENQLNLDGKLLVNIKNYNEIYKSLQISKNSRPQLNKLEFNFNYNFDQQIMNLNTIKINDETNKEVNDVLKKIILKRNKLQNQIYLKNIMKDALNAYSG